MESEQAEFAVDKVFMEGLKDRLDAVLPHMDFNLVIIPDSVEGAVIEGRYEGAIRLWVFQAYIKGEHEIPVIDKRRFQQAVKLDTDENVGFKTTTEELEADVQEYFYERIESPAARKIRKEMD